MATDVNQLAAAVAREAAHELDEAVLKITHCVNQLTDEQVWWRSRDDMNSIANLLLHMCGNLRQWIVSGVGEIPDTRNRPQEFSERGPIPKAELFRRLNDTVREAQSAMSRAAGGQLLGPRRIQGFDVTPLGAIFSSIPHFRGHTQEIIHLTREQLGDRYQFFWRPRTPEQGAPA
ncbi:MAG: DUF1572 family protein [Planctomycetales bacterium]|nr:DUF1572 family protein [Planctomycetales bacterium]